MSSWRPLWPVLGVVSLLAAGTAAAQGLPRVLVVGDSWAEEMFQDGVHGQVFANNGYAQYVAVAGGSGPASTVESGSTAAQWVQPARLQRIAEALAANPSIDTVQLTVGGNDFLGAWSTTMPPAQVEQLKAQILTDLIGITSFVLEFDPRLEIVLSFYDYPNFRDNRSIFNFVWTFFCLPLWNDLGQPNAAQLNAAAIEFIGSYADIADAHPRIFHVFHLGLMQNKFGIDGIPPGQLPLPGDPSRPSPSASMRNRGIGIDCFHLTPTGYRHLVQNLFDHYYARRFDTLLRSSFE